MKFEHTTVMNFENAFRGMRNPMNSWKQSDSYEQTHLRDDGLVEAEYIVGKKDMILAKKLVKAGSDHRKFLRQILVSVDIAAPLYWWKEFDTYKVGTVANSCSTMHKLATTPITPECFAFDSVNGICCTINDPKSIKELMCEILEKHRQAYIETNDRKYWRALIQLLPESWLQTRTVTINYENIRNMYHARKNHKLSEWSEDFCNWVKTLPYAKELITDE